MKLISNKVFHLLIFLAMIIFTLVLGKNLANEIPIHFDSKGNADQYGSKYILLFLMPIILAIVYLIIEIVLRNSKKKYDTIQFLQFYFIILFGVMHFYFILNNFIENINLFSFLPIPIAFSYVYIFILLRKINVNTLTGIRTKWTMKDQVVWRKTNNLGAKLFLINGLLISLSIFFPNLFFYFLIIPLILCVVVLSFYSYIKFKQNSLN